MQNPPSQPGLPDGHLLGHPAPPQTFEFHWGPRRLPDDVASQTPLPAAPGRQRLADLDPHLHCSVIGTCLSTAELRKAMRRFVDVDGLSELEVHHEAVRLTSVNADVAHTLHKLLDRRHDATVQRLARIKDVATLTDLWKQALAAGEIPGTYWAILTHRRTTSDLRQLAFGDVHMLSHLVGAANRADIRRLVAIEQENAELRDRNERLQERVDSLAGERDRSVDELQTLRATVGALEHTLAQVRAQASAPGQGQATATALADAVAVQTQRREAAESRAQLLDAEVLRLLNELEHLHEQTLAMGHELGAAEMTLRRQAEAADGRLPSDAQALSGQRLLYVGGRPSTHTAIRDIVLRQGGEYRRHGGGLEDRKGLLASAIAWADIVVFPVDCIDHDSALNLKRACQHQGTPFIALRSASVASFAAAIVALEGPPDMDNDNPPHGGPCLRHG